jgi:hypothetical protein
VARRPRRAHAAAAAIACRHLLFHAKIQRSKRFRNILNLFSYLPSQCPWKQQNNSGKTARYQRENSGGSAADFCCFAVLTSLYSHSIRLTVLDIEHNKNMFKEHAEIFFSTRPKRR